MCLPRKFCLFSIIASFLLLVSCTTTAYSDYTIPQNEGAFWIVADNDFLNLAPVITEELQSARYTAKTVRTRSSIPDPQPIASGGSGFSIGKDLLVSNSHVIEGGSRIFVNHSGKSHPAQVLLDDTANDVALLRVEGIEFPYSFNIIDSKSYAVADPIYVLGYPITDILGDEIRVTDGIVNAKSGIGNDQKKIQISAQIQPGNSGGPVIDKNFNVIGIASSKLNDTVAYQATGNIAQNVNFAIKSDLLSIVGDQYIENTEMLNKVTDMTEGIQATVKIDVEIDSINPYNTLKNYYIEFGYTYYYDLIHYTLTRLNIMCYDLTTDEMIAEASFTGESFQSAKGIVRSTVRELLQSMNPAVSSQTTSATK